jgi:hypothetical protein
MSGSRLFPEDPADDLEWQLMIADMWEAQARNGQRGWFSYIPRHLADGDNGDSIDAGQDT